MFGKRGLLIGVLAAVALSYGSAFAGQYFVEVSAGSESENNSLFSRVGTFKEDGTIDWGNNIKIGKGKSPSVALQGKNAVLVYRGTSSENEDELFYRVGTVDLTTMAATWGAEVKYSKGAGPSVALKGTRVVEVHQSPAKDKIWITVGVMDPQRQQIAWGTSVLYDEAGRSPAISIEGE